MRQDLAPAVLERLGSVRIWPPRHRDSRNAEGKLDFVRGMGRPALIGHLPVVDVLTGEERTSGTALETETADTIAIESQRLSQIERTLSSGIKGAIDAYFAVDES